MKLLLLSLSLSQNTCPSSIRRCLNQNTFNYYYIYFCVIVQIELSWSICLYIEIFKTFCCCIVYLVFLVSFFINISFLRSGGEIIWFILSHFWSFISLYKMLYWSSVQEQKLWFMHQCRPHKTDFTSQESRSQWQSN